MTKYTYTEEDFERCGLPEKWEKLTLASDFLFGKIMLDKELCTEMMRRILPAVKIGDIKYIELQKPVQPGFYAHGVRFDMLVETEKRNVYDVEIQTTSNKNIARRTRAYHSVMSNDILAKGENYYNLPDVFVIFICTFDPFKRGRHVYTFKSFCSEDKSLELNDGACTTFLNTKGKLNDADPKMKAFLNLLNGVGTKEDPFILELMKRIEIAKQNGQWRREYMIADMELNAMRAEIREETMREGLREGRRKGIREGKREGRREGILEGRREGILEGRREGITEGDRNRQIATVKRMRELGLNEELIQDVTGLSYEELSKL